jgi:hypothetical protein
MRELLKVTHHESRITFPSPKRTLGGMRSSCAGAVWPDMDALRQLQEDVAYKLKAETRFADVPVFIDRPRSAQEALQMQSAIDKALAGMTKQNNKAGLACRVFMPEAECPSPNIPGPLLEVVLTVQVIEKPMFNEGPNGTGISAEQCALNIVSSLQHWTRGNAALYCDRRALRVVPDEGSIILDVVIRTQFGVPGYAFVAAPVIAEGETLLTLTCATEGAAIYYTTNGSTPAPGNAAATLYTAPFEPPASGVVRVCAFKASFHASRISELVISNT